MICNLRNNIPLSKSLLINRDYFGTWQQCSLHTVNANLVYCNTRNFRLPAYGLNKRYQNVRTLHNCHRLQNNDSLHKSSPHPKESKYVNMSCAFLRTPRIMSAHCTREYTSQHSSQKNSQGSGLSSTAKWLAVILSGGLACGVAYKVLVVDKEASEEDVQEKTKILNTKTPTSSEDIPKDVPYLLIGGGAASFAASRAIKSIDPKAKILIITKEMYNPYMRPPLSKELIHNKNRELARKLEFTQWNEVKRSVFYEPEPFYTPCKDLNESETGGISVASGWEVVQLNPELRYAVLQDGKRINYKKCLIATGATPENLPIFANSNQDIQKKVTTYRTLADFFEIDKVIEKGAKSIAVVGGGFSGSELAFSLGRRGIQVSLIYKEDGLLTKILPQYLSISMTSKIEKEGVTLFHNSEIECVELLNKKIKITTNKQDNILVDHVIVAAGVKANTDLAESAALEIDNTLGGYLVNAELEARKDLYVAGDCASFYDKQFGRRRVEHHDFAIVTGRLAGENMTGAGKAFEYQPNFWSDFGPELGYEAVGVIDSTLPTVGVYLQNSPMKYNSALEELDPEATNVKPNDPNNFPRGVIFYLRNEKVVGVLMWNIFGKAVLARRILKSSIKVEDLQEAAKLFNASDTD